MSVDLKADTLSVHVLNVGDGDSIVVELPEERGSRSHIVVDCKRGDKSIKYLKQLGAKRLELVVASHPHADHINGLVAVMKEYGDVEQFWDSGFRHNSDTWYELVRYVRDDRPEVQFIRPTSGLTTVMSGVEVTVLAPSISLRNRYDTYGVNINNSSIVLKLTYKDETIILAGDAQLESWGKVTEEFPHFEKTSNPSQHIKVEKNYFPLDCRFLKVSHHGSKHGTALEVVEKLKPNVAAISCDSPSEYGFPHHLATDSIEEVTKKVLVSHKGSIVFWVNGDGSKGVHQYTEGKYQVPPGPNRV
ncbi:MAG: MBL fold metallo-hydrolase [Candidatus Bathyarchaeota archaeon]